MRPGLPLLLVGEGGRAVLSWRWNYEASQEGRGREEPVRIVHSGNRAEGVAAASSAEGSCLCLTDAISGQPVLPQGREEADPVT